MADKKGLTQKEARNLTKSTDRETSEAWHQARADFQNTYGSLDPGTNSGGYKEAFGEVGGPLPKDK